MIRVFSPSDKIYSTNGDVVINPFKAKVHKEDNGKFYLTVEADISYVDFLTANMLKIGSITIDDVPDALKEEVEDLLNAKSDSDKAE